MSNLVSSIDNSVYNLLMNIQCEYMDYFMLLITNLASAPVLIIIAIIILICLKNKLHIINLTAVFIINRMLKLIFARERPQDVMHIVTETGYSFPSAHTMIGTAFYGLLIYLIYKSNNKYKMFYIAILTILIFFIGISRIYLGAHYATDVIGGIVFAIIYLVGFIICMKKSERKVEK